MFKNFIWNGRKFKADDQGTVFTEELEALEIDECESRNAVLIHFPYDECSETGVYFEGKRIDCEADKNTIILDRLIAHMFCKNDFPDILTKVNHISYNWKNCSAQKLYWAPIGKALTEPERNFKKLDILGHSTHFFIYCPEENCIFANPKHAAFMFSPETDSERQQIQTKITKCANGNLDSVDYKHYMWCVVVFVKSREYTIEKIYDTKTGHLAIICRCPKITFLDEKFFSEEDIPYIKKALKANYIRKWDQFSGEYGEFKTSSEMMKLTKDFYENKKNRKYEIRKTASRPSRRKQTLKPEILLRLSEWLNLQSQINCLPPDKKDKLEKILSERTCTESCKDYNKNVCLYDSGAEDECPFNMIRKILKTEITEKSRFVLSTDQTPYFQIQDILKKL